MFQSIWCFQQRFLELRLWQGHCIALSVVYSIRNPKLPSAGKVRLLAIQTADLFEDPNVRYLKCKRLTGNDTPPVATWSGADRSFFIYLIALCRVVGLHPIGIQVRFAEAWQHFLVLSPELFVQALVFVGLCLFIHVVRTQHNAAKQRE